MGDGQDGQTFAYADDILGPLLTWCKHNSPSHLRTAVEGPYTARDQDAEAGVRSG